MVQGVTSNEVLSDWDEDEEAEHSRRSVHLPLPPPLTPSGLRRKVSTHRCVQNQISFKEGYLLKQPKSFQRWKKRYFRLKRGKLFYSRTPQEAILNEVDLCSMSVAEYASKTGACCFQVITPECKLVLCADSRQSVQDWMTALKTASQPLPSTTIHEYYLAQCSGEHVWFVASHNRPVYCNVCREALSGVAWHGLSCDVCKLKVHKRCAVQVNQRCKWTTLQSLVDVFGDSFTQLTQSFTEQPSTSHNPTPTTLSTPLMPHQWVEGNMHMSGRCAVCGRACGSLLRLVDWHCVWCNVRVHAQCRARLPNLCALGQNRASVLPPVLFKLVCISESGVASLYEADSACANSGRVCLPLAVFVNTRSGAVQGSRVLSQFRRMLNPLQVFDLNASGPEFGLRLFSVFDSFRVLVCGGDGTVGWMFSAIDRLQLHYRVYVGVLPLGTGNDMARVLGWGHAFDPSVPLSHLLTWHQRAHTAMLDRWSVYSHEQQSEIPATDGSEDEGVPSANIQCSVDSQVSKIMVANDETAFSSAKLLCETVTEFLGNVEHIYALDDADADIVQDECHMTTRCSNVQQKLQNLLRELKQESAREEAQRQLQDSGGVSVESDDEMPGLSRSATKCIQHRRFARRNNLMLRANSLKKAVRDIVEQTERAVSEDSIDQSVTGSTRRSIRHRHRHKTVTVGGTVTALFTHSSPVQHSTKDRSTEPQLSPIDSVADVLGDMNTTGNMNVNVKEHVMSTSSTSGVHSAQWDIVDQPTNIQLTESVLPQARTVHAPQHHRLCTAPTCLSLMSVPVAKPMSEPNLSVLAAVTSDSSPDCSLPAFCGTDTSANHSRTGSPSYVLPDLCSTEPSVSAMSKANEIPLSDCKEIQVMNNYCSIGLDAKIALEFHEKRNEYPNKSRSRSKLYLMYGVLGGKELWNRTYRNLERRVHLRCDGRLIDLPALQGLVIMNIPSYHGGMNFWGSSTALRQNRRFRRQSMDDRILEVVAIFGVMHCATSRVVRLTNHRIAQCRELSIQISGGLPIAMQVDGEPWMQQPGTIRIVHKNRAQVLVRNAQFDATLRTWNESADSVRLPSALSAVYAEEACQHIVDMLHAAHKLLLLLSEDQLNDAGCRARQQATVCLQSLYPPEKKLNHSMAASEHLSEAVQCLDVLSQNLPPAPDAAFQDAVNILNKELEAVQHLLSADHSLAAFDPQSQSVPGVAGDICNVADCSVTDQAHAQGASASAVFSQSVHASPSLKSTRLGRWLRSTVTRMRRRPRSASNSRTHKHDQQSTNVSVNEWTVQNVGEWLQTIDLVVYAPIFAQHDIAGAELLRLNRTDIKDMGINKIGHVKRLEAGIQQLNSVRALQSSHSCSVPLNQ